MRDTELTKRRQFHIHGDNIVECERAMKLINTALSTSHVALIGPRGNITNPTYEIVVHESSQKYIFICFPGFGRWNYDIRQAVHIPSGLREAPDVILTEVRSRREIPLLAIEYSGALAAGNQAWQRNGRAYSSGLAKIPFVYVAELGGYELDMDRSPKAVRLPNPAVPFSYLSFSAFAETTVIPVYVRSPAANDAKLGNLASSIGEADLVNLIRVVILGGDMHAIIDSLKRKAMSLVKQIASDSRRGTTLSPEQWTDLSSSIERNGKGALVAFLLGDARLRWAKTTYIKRLTDSVTRLMRTASSLSIGLTSSKLPMCLMPGERRRCFSEVAADLYPGIDQGFLDWLGEERPLAICWIMGFKPRGDDARPDRGLPPLTRMLVGSETDMLTVVYGPAPPNHWTLLRDNPGDLRQQNGLWEAIMVTSDGVLVDSDTDDVTTHGFLKQHWKSVIPVARAPVCVDQRPNRIGENDVDTAIHTLFSLGERDNVFEGFCNPPGGDWSGISLLTFDRSKELRWLSLPRVSGAHAKRPDHVLQLFGHWNCPIVLAIESKETPSSVEPEIGPRLLAYMRELMDSPASVERNRLPGAKWERPLVANNSEAFHYASGVAFLTSELQDLSRVKRKAGADLQIGLHFRDGGTACEIHLLASSAVGEAITELAQQIPVHESHFSVHVH